jgi:hypothetical protein
MKNEVKQHHTLTPWEIGSTAYAYGWDIIGNGLWIGSVHNSHDNHRGFPLDDEGEANAAFIVRAVNEYEQNKGAIKAALADSAGLTLENIRLKNRNEELLEAVKDMYSAITNGHSLALTHEQYKELIAKAEGL